MGEKTSSALKRTGTVIKDTGSAVGSKISGAASSFKVITEDMLLTSSNCGLMLSVALG